MSTPAPAPENEPLAALHAQLHRYESELAERDALIAQHEVSIAERDAMIEQLQDSLIECAKANGLEPYAYLRHVFTELPKAQSLAEVEALLPTRLDPAALARDSLQGAFPAVRQ